MKKQSSTLLLILISMMCILPGVHGYSQGGNLKAVADTIDLVPLVPVQYNILANDTIPLNDTLKSVFVTGDGSVQCIKLHGATWQFTFLVPQWGRSQKVTGGYRLFTMSGDTSSTTILFRIRDYSYAYLDINNVRARFSSDGSHFFGENAEYEVPKGSGKTSIFLNSFWIGGLDDMKQLHFAGMRYGQGPTTVQAHTKFDFFAGPVMDSTKYSIYQDTLWNYIWNLKKTDIDYHRAHFWEAGYQPIKDILTWPGNGDTTLGQAWKLAPFSDRNGDGKYDPYDGDYPEVRGDQALFFIFNDDRGQHGETYGSKLRIEIHGMAYAYNLPNDTALKNTTFLYYKIYNRSQNTYDSTLLGVFTDIDLGYPMDDYMGCDVQRSMYYGYNGTPVDGTGQPNAYGANPPTQSVTILAGPYMDPDGLDNPKFNNLGTRLCDASVNGLNFGDSIADNERLGMQRYVYFNNSNAGVPAYMTDPLYAQDYYRLMTGIWKDGTHMVYGGNGHPSSGGYGPACNFMFPGVSDTLNWGVGCQPPNGPVNWTEETALNNPSDRRGLGVTGPVTFLPGEALELDIAFSWARNYTEPNQHASVAKLRTVTDAIAGYFSTNHLPDGGLIYGTRDPLPATSFPVRLYPNPATDRFTIDFMRTDDGNTRTVELISSSGITVGRLAVDGSQRIVILNAKGLAAGVYFVRISDSRHRVNLKLVVIH